MNGDPHGQSVGAGRVDAGSSRDVVLLGYPLDVGLRATEHYSEVLREFALMLATGTAAVGSVPEQVITMIGELERQGARNHQLEELRRAAKERGETAADLVLRDIPGSAAGLSQRLDALLDQADGYVTAGSVLFLAPDAEILVFRRWYLEQLVGQLTGAEPSPWPGPL